MGDELPYFFVCVCGLLADGLVIKESVFFLFGEGCLDEFTKVFERDSLEYDIGGTEGVCFLSYEFSPAAPWVFGYILYESWLEGILMDVAKECDEVMKVVAWL